MASKTKTLDIYIGEEQCGTLQEDRHGQLSFEYLHGYNGVSLSLSMPVSLERYGDRTVRPYLMGLLPDEATTRNAIGAQHGVSGNNPFRLLEIIGLDCPGAVQAYPHNVALPAKEGAGKLSKLKESDIEQILASLREDAASAWTDNDSPSSGGRWSLAGCQAKIALRQQDGEWYSCNGNAASTHILKPGVVGYDKQALVEHISMQAARLAGLPVAKTQYRLFGSEPGVIIERYDRTIDDAGHVLRIHQEDFCQALSISPEIKYAEQGGPTTPQIIDMLKTTGVNAKENIYRFILYLFFNYLIGATDAHGKNHSIAHVAPGEVRLAPLYDVASIAPYETLVPRRRKPLRAALSIGGENRFGEVGKKNIEKMVRDCQLAELGFDAELLYDRFSKMAKIVPSAVQTALEEARKDKLLGIDDIANAMQKEIAGNCARSLENL